MLNLDFLLWICEDFSWTFRVISRNIEPVLFDFRPPPDRGHTTVRVLSWRNKWMNGDWSMGDPWNINNFKQALVDEKRSNYKPTFGAMRHSPTNERGVIADVKVIDVEKRRSKEHSSNKNYVRMNEPLIFAWFPAVLLSFVTSTPQWFEINSRKRNSQHLNLIALRFSSGIRVESKMAGWKPILHISSIQHVFWSTGKPEDNFNSWAYVK